MRNFPPSPGWLVSVLDLRTLSSWDTPPLPPRPPAALGDVVSAAIRLRVGRRGPGESGDADGAKPGAPSSDPSKCSGREMPCSVPLAASPAGPGRREGPDPRAPGFPTNFDRPLRAISLCWTGSRSSFKKKAGPSGRLSEGKPAGEVLPILALI